MGLIKCADCGNRVSEQATACPSCGRPPLAPPQAKKSGSSGAVGCVLILLVSAGIAFAVNQANQQSEGRHEFDWGGVFTGSMIGGRPERGKMELPNSTVIEGDWTRNEGTITYPDGRVYHGQWDGDPMTGAPMVGPWYVERPQGRGKMIWPDGRTQEGVWENGAFVGR